MQLGDPHTLITTFRMLEIQILHALVDPPVDLPDDSRGTFILNLILQKMSEGYLQNLTTRSLRGGSRLWY